MTSPLPLRRPARRVPLASVVGLLLCPTAAAQVYVDADFEWESQIDCGIESVQHSLGQAYGFPVNSFLIINPGDEEVPPAGAQSAYTGTNGPIIYNGAPYFGFLTINVKQLVATFNKSDWFKTDAIPTSAAASYICGMVGAAILHEVTHEVVQKSLQDCMDDLSIAGEIDGDCAEAVTKLIVVNRIQKEIDKLDALLTPLEDNVEELETLQEELQELQAADPPDQDATDAKQAEVDQAQMVVDEEATLLADLKAQIAGLQDFLDAELAYLNEVMPGGKTRGQTMLEMCPTQCVDTLISFPVSSSPAINPLVC